MPAQISQMSTSVTSSLAYPIASVHATSPSPHVYIAMTTLSFIVAFISASIAALIHCHHRRKRHPTYSRTHLPLTHSLNVHHRQRFHYSMQLTSQTITSPHQIAHSRTTVTASPRLVNPDLDPLFTRTLFDISDNEGDPSTPPPAYQRLW